MSINISRRRVLTAGTASPGLLYGAVNAQAEQETKESLSHPPFLSPWSPPPDLKRDLTPGSTPIRLAAWARGKTTLDYPPDKMSITEMVKNIRERGYTSGNANITRYEKSPWLDASESEIRELKESLQTYDVTFFDMHTTGSNIQLDLTERSKCNRYTVEACEAAERVGCPMVTTHVGSLSSEMPFSPYRDNWTLETWKLSVKTMRQILKDSAGSNVAFGVEATNMTIMNNPRAHLALIEEIGDPRLKVCIDPVNMINLGTYFRNTELIDECFDLLGEHIIAAHAKDTYVLPNRMSAYITEVVPGEGILDYETYLVRLSRLSYPRPLLIEHIPEKKYPEAKEYIEKTAEKTGVKIY
ncbi:sugar phosphate isomerase/epimerase family protein [Candidatus Latescibacterota bacterium]